jgi:hypothetical protein
VASAQERDEADGRTRTSPPGEVRAGHVSQGRGAGEDRSPVFLPAGGGPVATRVPEETFGAKPNAYRGQRRA